ncbi:ankyrin repeat and KH domain-containing protein 1 [Colletotrichum spaethianum]|uniref:Ankyrin repeat and KH domain-containing protein 1 n=1 Tax=Colletotrichum spaethianum TaxID=700344 RepID=A0AA37P8J8_9PEZI|nr:ankyrin repeat and KH domain-containing protein 1 [Colletotrichum spaethianum]GKT47630.1 ankyrin repeat and KH domain-containing protein 1 [Colletotrichum spaethianum]
MLQSAIRDGKLLAVRLLLSAGADVNRADKQTALHTATFRKDFRFAEIIIKHGADMEALNLHKLTPLQQAVANGFEETSRLLLERGANVNAQYVRTSDERPSRREDTSAASKTPLMLACGLYIFQFE